MADKPGFLNIVQSVLASAFGVQSQQKYQQDFSQSAIAPYIVVGIVFVCVASGHRNEAIEACNFLIDWLKTKAPFWKYEKTLTGGQWVESKISDEQATLKWGK